MPDWTPDWSDVDFDHAAARAAADACRRAARVADASATTTGGARASAVEDWTGSYRDDFDIEEPVVLDELTDTRTELLTLATAIEEGATAATAEQTHRESERDRWWRELAAEQEADDPAPAPAGGGGGPTPS